jgi:HEAT repeat protein
MTRILFLAAAFGALSFFLADDASAHGGSFRGPNGGVPPGLREPSDPEPPPPPPTDPGGPGGPTTPSGPTGPATPDDQGHSTPNDAPPPPPTGPANGPKKPAATKSLSFESWRFWWAYNNDDILNLKGHIYGSKTSSASPLFFTSKEDTKNRRNAQRPTERAIVNKIIPALKRSLNRNKDHEDIHGGALVALGKIGSIDFVPIFEAAANNTFKTEKGLKVKFGYQATESAVLALGLLPKLDERGKSEVRKILLSILDNDDLRSRERAWAGVCLGLQRDTEAIKPLWERLSRKYKGKDKYNIPAGILCGLGLIGDETVLPDLHEALESGKIGGKEIDDRIRAYVGFAISKIASPESLEVLNKTLTSRRIGRTVKRSIAIGCGTCGAKASPDMKDATVKALRKFINKSGGDPSGENFALIALSQIGTDEALKHLLKLADGGKYGQRPYAALGLATHCWYKDRAAELKKGEPMDPAMRSRIKDALIKLSDKYKDTDTKAAMMLGRGLLKDKSAVEECVKLITRKGDPTLRGFCCVTLGLIGEASENVKDALKLALADRRSTDLRRDAATGLGLLKDADAVKLLIDELKAAKSFAVQGQLITAIGTIGDHTAIDPLIDILDNTSRPSAARAMAAVGLGMIGDLLPLSKLSRLSKNYNYRASVEDLDELLYIL